jgi:hypothetical protein
MDYAFQYVADHGIELEKDYPYTGGGGVLKCSWFGGGRV